VCVWRRDRRRWTWTPSLTASRLHLTRVSWTRHWPEVERRQQRHATTITRVSGPVRPSVGRPANRARRRSSAAARVPDAAADDDDVKWSQRNYGRCVVRRHPVAGGPARAQSTNYRLNEYWPNAVNHVRAAGDNRRTFISVEHARAINGLLARLAGGGRRHFTAKWSVHRCSPSEWVIMTPN